MVYSTTVVCDCGLVAAFACFSRSLHSYRLRLWSGGEAHQTVSLQRQTCLTSSNRTGKGLLYLYSMRLSEFVCLVEELPRDRRTSFSPMAAEDHITESLPASLSTALTQARMARATASAERAERASGSRSTSKDSVLTDRSLAPPDRISTRAKDDCFQRKVACLSTLCQSQDMFKKGVMSSMSSVTSQAPWESEGSECVIEAAIAAPGRRSVFGVCSCRQPSQGVWIPCLPSEDEKPLKGSLNLKGQRLPPLSP